jgi:Ca2+-binding RTX toxin-like protein
VIDGGPGVDAVVGDNFGAEIRGGAGNDIIDGGDGNDFFLIGDHATFSGAVTRDAGNDTVRGGAVTRRR